MSGFDAGQISLVSGNSVNQNTGSISLATGETARGSKGRVALPLRRIDRVRCTQQREFYFRGPSPN